MMAPISGICKLEEVLIKCAVGEILISGCTQGIHEIKLQEYAALDPEAKDTSAPFKVCEGPQEMIPSLEQCTSWLRAYFCEPQLIENLPVPAFHHQLFDKDSFNKTVLLALLNNVKMGETITYKDLAEAVGNGKAARAVGGAMRSNPVPLLIPCHRVICSDGNIGNYSGGGSDVKRWLLAHEKHVKHI